MSVVQTISTAIEKDIKKSKWFTEASGDEDGVSYVTIDLVPQKTSSNYGAFALARIQNAEVEYYSGERASLTIKAYHPTARDCDHWLHRVFNAQIEDLSINVISYGRSEYFGYLKELHAYKIGEGPEIEESEEECHCGEKHGWVDSFLPPLVFGENPDGSTMPFRLLVRINVYPTKKYGVSE